MRNSLQMFTFHSSKKALGCTQFCVFGRGDFSQQSRGLHFQFGWRSIDNKSSWTCKRSTRLSKSSPPTKPSKRRRRISWKRFMIRLAALSMPAAARIPSISKDISQRSSRSSTSHWVRVPLLKRVRKQKGQYQDLLLIKISQSFRPINKKTDNKPRASDWVQVWILQSMKRNLNYLLMSSSVQTAMPPSNK